MPKLVNPIATAALPLWNLPQGAILRLINVSENETYLVEAPDFKAVLRVHRQGYNTGRTIESELEWSAALPLETPTAIAGRDGKLVQTVDGHFMVLFEFIEGVHPNEDQDLSTSFRELGRIAAQTHTHSQNWQRSDTFERMSWDLPAVFGESAHWGGWRDAPNVTNDIRRILERVERVVTHRLNAFGQSPENYGLIHADMRLANLLVEGDKTRLIDFDDCGFGWFLYDFAAAISFIEDHPQIPTLRAAWIKGYREFRPLSEDEIFEIDSFIMLRRMALLAWIGSHMEATEPQALAPDFARVTAELGVGYLAKM
jgi:Ser/Thr protein kinase RdoA (MazF antagonist)